MYKEKWVVKPNEIALRRGEEKYVIALLGNDVPEYGIMFDSSTGKKKLYLEDDEGCVMRIKEITWNDAAKVALELAQYAKDLCTDDDGEEETDWEDIAYVLFNQLASLYLISDEIDLLEYDLMNSGIRKEDVEKLMEDWRMCIED